MDAVMAHARKFRVQPAELPGLLTGWRQRLAALDESADLAALEAMISWARCSGRLEVRLERRPVAASTTGDRVQAVTLLDLRSGATETIEADLVIDATELGDLLPLAGVEYVSGAESQDDHGEPHAIAGPPQPDNVQAFTWCFPIAYDPGGEHVIDRPAAYGFWRDYVPAMEPPWPGRLLAWHYSHPHTLEPCPFRLFADEPGPGASLWAYRRIVAASQYDADPPHEVTVVNWPQNDYWEGNVIDQPAEVVAEHLQAARELSLCLLYWMQTEAPRGDGGSGYPGLYLRPDLAGTADGLAKAPYFRESRRIRAEFTVTESHIGAGCREHRAEPFADSVGIGSYRIDLHPSANGRNYLDIPSLPFQIPLGALLPIRVENLLPACKNLGTTHVTNGCYRLHPVEWNIGEAAGLLAAFALRLNLPPRAVRRDPTLLEEFQKLLRQQGIELAWPQVHPG
ncbi:MAG: FAD-dependent oxidoreductase [Armatimonadetes bacterium]|nr:FAD-dependent oxidoreductase [Armatimonadota bacterium]